MVIIFAATGAFFLLMNAVGLGLLFYLRLVNVFFCLSVNRTIKKMNLGEKKLSL
jgi:hypothetical protein